MSGTSSLRLKKEKKHTPAGYVTHKKIRSPKVNLSSFPYPLEVDVGKFVTVKLSKSNYFTWRTPMFRLIKRHRLEGFINGKISAEPKMINVPKGDGSKVIKQKNPKHENWKRSDELLRKWILDTLSPGDDDIHSIVKDSRTVKQVWAKLEKQHAKELGKNQNLYLPLMKAILDGDWGETHKFLGDQEYPDAIRAPITNYSSTPLLVAAESGRRNQLVRELVDRMSPDDLAHADRSGGTALHLAARGGNIEAAKLLVENNSQLPYTLNAYEELPLHVAASNGHKDMIVYLLGVTRKDTEPTTFEDELGTKLVNDLIAGELYGIALFVVQRYPKLACGNPSPLTKLAKMPSAFRSGAHLNFWQNLIYPYVPTHLENLENHSTDRGDVESANRFVSMGQKLWGQFWKLAKLTVPHIKIMGEKKLIHYQSKKLVQVLCLEIVKLEFPKNFPKIGEPLRIAAEDGVHEVVEEIFYSFPTAIYSGYYKGQTVFHYAIMNRREKVFNLLKQIGEHYYILLSDIDESCNNCLHLAGNLKTEVNYNLKASAAGAALQMQRELQWFKEVEKMIPNQDKDKKNKDEKTPAMLFTEAHLTLVKEGETWMKDTANSCIIVATLVVTIMFAAAITVPGGNNGDTGLPFFATKKAFIVFAITDALALFSSTSSVLMFLSILTSRYAEGDFLYALPKRLIIGLGTLFLSILFMMIAFTATLEIMFGDKYPWIIYPVVVFASVPVILFVLLQSPLFMVMIKSTYWPGIFGKQRDRLFSQISKDTL